MQFDAFIGNRPILERLRKKLREGRFPHALIFSGPEGVGKNACATMMAKALNCDKSEAGNFCDACTNCRKIESGTHADVMRITVEEEATQIKIAQIRRVLGLLNLQPLEGRSKVFIIDPADALNEEAANALLKSLEEPPENTFFILTTVNANELLLTVRSRCQVYHFTPLTLDDIRGHGINDELTIRWSQGSIGRARSLDMERIKSEREAVFDFLETVIAAREEQFQDLVRLSSDFVRGKQEFEGRLEILAVLIADLLYIKESVPRKVINADVADRLNRLAGQMSDQRLLAMADFLRFMESSLKSYINRQILTDVLALTTNEATAAWLQ
jgi:DNA polymerase III delta' subunit